MAITALSCFKLMLGVGCWEKPPLSQRRDPLFPSGIPTARVLAPAGLKQRPASFWHSGGIMEPWILSWSVLFLWIAG